MTTEQVLSAQEAVDVVAEFAERIETSDFDFEIQSFESVLLKAIEHGQAWTRTGLIARLEQMIAGLEELYPEAGPQTDCDSDTRDKEGD